MRSWSPSSSSVGRTRSSTSTPGPTLVIRANLSTEVIVDRDFLFLFEDVGLVGFEGPMPSDADDGIRNIRLVRSDGRLLLDDIGFGRLHVAHGPPCSRRS